MANNIFENLRQRAAVCGPVRVAVAGAMTPDMLEAACMAHDMGIAEPILVGPSEIIARMCAEKGGAAPSFEIIHAESPEEIAQTAVDAVRQGRARLLMKGHIETRLIMKAVLKKENDFRTGGQISHVGILCLPSFDRPFFVTDGAINIAPSLEDKAVILSHAVQVAHAVGVVRPKVAVLCPTETVNPKIPSTLDAQSLMEMQREKGVFGECDVEGPYALDNAVSEEAARNKEISGVCAGKADVLLVPDLMSGNILIKAMEHLAHAEKAGILMGAKSPIVLTSRASTPLSKVNSIAVGSLIVGGAF